jgi:hypothetical protein
MPNQLLWGHGSFRTSNGYFTVPEHVEIHFFIPDNASLDDAAVRFFEFADLSGGVTAELVAKAKAQQNIVGRVIKTRGDAVKNYKLESIIGDFLASGSKNAIRQANVWTPGKETNDGDAVTDLVTIVRERSHLGSNGDPLILEWCACTTNYVGDQEAKAPVNKGKKIKAPGSSCCYITTATCSALDLGDDCAPLATLRWFRDEVVLQSPTGDADIGEYYANAPAIVRAIDAQADRDAIYDGIYRDHLAPALAAISRGQYQQAYGAYRDMVHSLQRRYLPGGTGG